MKQLNLYCPINGTGYGITSSNIALSMNSLGVDVSLFVLGQGVMVDNPVHQKTMIKMLGNARKYNPEAPCLKIWHQHDLAARVGRGDYYAFPFFEVDKLFEWEIYGLNNTDGVFTASEWGKKVLQENGVTKPVYVAPLGVDGEIFNNNSIKLEKSEDDPYVFLHIGKWETRKGQDFLLKAFEKSFDINDNVELWLLPYNPFLSNPEVENWLSLVNNNKLSSKIKIYNRLPTQKDVANLIANADCGVFMSRAEGWNNEIPEMMAMNKPIITTNFSAHTEYCNENNSFLVEVKEKEVANDGKWFHGHGSWAKLSNGELEQTVEHMKYVYNNKVRSNPFGVETAKKYSWNNTVESIQSGIKY